MYAQKLRPRHRQKSTESLNFQLQQEKHQADALKEAVKKVIMTMMTVMMMMVTIKNHLANALKEEARKLNISNKILGFSDQSKTAHIHCQSFAGEASELGPDGETEQ